MEYVACAQMEQALFFFSGFSLEHCVGPAQPN